MKKHLILILILSPCLLFAKSRTVLKYGIVRTDFRQDASEKKSKRGFGIGREYFPKNNKNFFFSYGLMIVRKSVLLPYRSWPESWDEWTELNVGDIRADVAFIEWPIKFGFQTPDFFNSTHMGFFIGTSLSIPAGDFSRVKTRYTRHLPKADRSRFDYNFSDELYMNPTFNSIFGALIDFKFIGLALQYSRALQPTTGFTGFVIEDYFDCWQFMLRFSF